MSRAHKNKTHDAVHVSGTPEIITSQKGEGKRKIWRETEINTKYEWKFPHIKIYIIHMGIFMSWNIKRIVPFCKYKKKLVQSVVVVVFLTPFSLTIFKYKMSELTQKKRITFAACHTRIYVFFFIHLLSDIMVLITPEHLTVLPDGNCGVSVLIAVYAFAKYIF